MRHDYSRALPGLADVQLGDIITFPGGQAYSVRAVERALAQVVGTMAGFILVGEVGPRAALLSLSGDAAAPVTVYSPLDHIPAHARSATIVCQGVVSYWAPHLPNLSGAQGELGYKVAKLRGSVDPMVLLWRGEERVVFLRSGTQAPESLRVEALPRDAAATEVDQLRYAATVSPSPLQSQPLPLPAERPLRVGGGRRR